MRPQRTRRLRNPISSQLRRSLISFILLSAICTRAIAAFGGGPGGSFQSGFYNCASGRTLLQLRDILVISLSLDLISSTKGPVSPNNEARRRALDSLPPGPAPGAKCVANEPVAFI
ncbi:hypothetical protein EVAR_87604_1 [Eumeta japonica]|uniref:Uncharacterized protein n=1 Tax=Eumeta variegata TaxID=151549 RepID=A0A4C1WLA9_EUMVA|nr:hypothetical protein EVAR_87604_1 [Eumeta japonica]